GARVLRVDVDRPPQKSAPQELRAAQLAPMHRVRAGSAHQVGHNLAQNDRFGKRLGADTHQRTTGGRRRRRTASQGARKNQPPTHPPSRWGAAHEAPPLFAPRAASRLAVARKRSTKRSAGACDSSSKLPRCTMVPSRMSTMWLAKKAASEMSCVTMTTV